MARKTLTVTVKVDIYFHIRFEEVNKIMFLINENSLYSNTLLGDCLRLDNRGQTYVGVSTSAGGLDQRWFVNVDMF